MADRLYLDVPYTDKDQAKAFGARWDPQAKRWYAPRAGIHELERWAAKPPLPDLLPGEDRTFGQGLFVDLVPASCWFTNVRSCVAAADWERLRRMVLNRAEQRCEICATSSDPSVKRWLEVHERWAYDAATHVQSLRRLICLCTDCHTTTHFGFAQLRGLDGQAFEHLVEVTEMDETEAGHEIDAAFTLWQQRSQYDWELDLSILTATDIAIVQPQDANQRHQAAHTQLTIERDNKSDGSWINKFFSNCPD